MKAPFSRIPAVPVAIFFAVGIIACCESDGSFVVPLVSVALAAILLGFKRQYFAIMAFAIAVGWFIAAIHQPKDAPDSIINKPLKVYGVVVDKAEGDVYTHLGIKIYATKGDIDSLYVPMEYPLLCDLSVHTPYVDAMPGDTVTFKTKLQRIESQPDLPYTADYNRRKRLMGVTVSAMYYKGDVPVVGKNNGVNHIINEVRDAIFNGIVDSPVNPPAASFLLAMMLGDKSFLQAELVDDFRTSGLAHMLAISGLHVGVLVWIFSLVLITFRRMKGGRVRFILLITLVWIYAVIVGLPASVVRTAVMITVYYLARMMQRGVSGFNSLAISVLVILLFDPYSLYLPGFQLSVAAVASILWFAPRLVPKDLHGGLRFVADAAVIPVAAMLGTGLISAFWFHRFPVAFMFSNMIACAILPIFMLLAVLVIGCTMVGINASFLGVCIDFLYGLLENVAHAFSSPPFADIQGIWLSTAAVIAGIVVVLLLAIALEVRKRFMIPVVGCSVVLFIIAVIFPHKNIASNEMWLLNSRGCTDILIRDNGNALIFTTARETDFPAISQKWSKRYRDYLGYYGCRDSLDVYRCDCQLGRYVSQNKYISSDNAVIAVVDCDTMKFDWNIKPDYVLVCKGFKGNVVSLATITRADTVILSCDLNKRRCNRYFRECTDAGVPVLDLREIAPYKIGN